MPVLANQRHELYAQGVALGKTQTKAYIDAGYSVNGAEVSASKLLLNPKIVNRINELKQKSANKTVLTIARLTEDLLRIAGKGEDLAEASGLSVARGALMDAAKLNGLVVDKAQTSGDINMEIAITRKIVKE